MKPRTMNLAPPVSPKTDRQENSASPKRLTIADYHRLLEGGIIPESHQTELIRGEIVEMSAKGSPHSVCTGLLCRQLDRMIGDQVAIRSQEPITLSNESEPEPDVTIAEGKLEDYLEQHPSPNQVLMIVEVADSSLEYDRTIKLALYAEENIPHYWIANVKSKQMECHSNPYQDSDGKFSYQSRQIIRSDQRLSLPNFLTADLDLGNIFL